MNKYLVVGHADGYEPHFKIVEADDFDMAEHEFIAEVAEVYDCDGENVYIDFGFKIDGDVEEVTL